MHAKLLTLVGVAACAGLPRPATAQSEPVELFDGSFAGWSIENAPDGNIAIRDGVLHVGGSAGWLRSEQRYADFRLRVEFRFVTDDADSGIFVRTVADSSFGPGWPSNGYQLQMRNPVIESRFPAIGGFFRHGTPPGATEFDPAVAAEASSGTGLWQLLEIDIEGERLEARLNGTLLTRADGITNPTGYVGVQAETGIVEIRSIKIEPYR